MHNNQPTPIPLEQPDQETVQPEITDENELKRFLAQYQKKVLYYAQRMARYEDRMRRVGHERLPLKKQTRAVQRLTAASMEHSQAQRIVETLIAKLDKRS